MGHSATRGEGEKMESKTRTTLKSHILALQYEVEVIDPAIYMRVCVCVCVLSYSYASILTLIVLMCRIG